jgi:hypothetical protein
MQVGYDFRMEILKKLTTEYIHYEEMGSRYVRAPFYIIEHNVNTRL